MEERGKAEQLGARVGELERQLIAQKTEAEILGRRVEELTAGWMSKAVSSPSANSFRPPAQRSGRGEKVESELRAALAEAENRHQLATESHPGPRSASVEEQLKQSQEERGKLQREIAAMKQDAETTWANERMENALLRERINDVAAEVARLTATLEGPGSPIAAILEKGSSLPRRLLPMAAMADQCRLRRRLVDPKARLPIAFAPCRAALAAPQARDA